MSTRVQEEALGEYAQQGFTLENDGDIAVHLIHEGERVASFSQMGATKESLRDECCLHLVMKHGQAAKES